MVCTLLLAALMLPQDTLVMTLDQAVTHGIDVSPVVAAAAGAVAAPRGARAEAFGPFDGNPVLEWRRLRRTAAAGTTFDRELSVRQGIQLGGQNFLRSAAAGRRVDAAQAGVLDAERAVARDIRIAYAALVIASQRAAMVDTAAGVAERLARFAATRLEAGEINRLEHNAALLEAARQQSAAQRAWAARAERLGDLARLLGFGELPIDVSALPPLPDDPLLADDLLVRVALERRPDRRAAHLRARAAAQEQTAAGRDGWVPSLQLGGVVGREAGREDLMGFSVGLAIPLFRREQGARGLAVAERAVADAAVVAVEREIRADVAAAAARFRRARDAARRFAQDVLGAASENVLLSERAFDEGKISIADVVLLRSSAVAAQLEYLDVLGEAYAGWFELAAALATDPQDITSLPETDHD